MAYNFSIFLNRSKKLVDSIKDKYKIDDGYILFLSNFEDDSRFKQDSSFYYFTGLSYSNLILLIDISNYSRILFIPDYNKVRSLWTDQYIDENRYQDYGIDKIIYLCDKLDSFNFDYFKKENYKNLSKFLYEQKNKKLFTFLNNNQFKLLSLILDDLRSLHFYDIHDLVFNLRRNKSKEELENIYKAVEITILAHQAAAKVINEGIYEYQIEAVIDFVFKDSGAYKAFDNIVGSGPNSTILHYNSNKRLIKDGELVVVDIGAQYNYYNADLSRTYPSSGLFSKRQKDLYKIVFDCQEYIESIVKPGFYIFNKDDQDRSLYHLAKKFFKDNGNLDKYFTHNIGHFLGLDVHDISILNSPIQEFDVLTIEPGLYIKEENLGIRIEDNYWITNNGSISISKNLPKKWYEIEEFMINDETDDMSDDY